MEIEEMNKAQTLKRLNYLIDKKIASYLTRKEASDMAYLMDWYELNFNSV